jgi:hypothetical protein
MAKAADIAVNAAWPEWYWAIKLTGALVIGSMVAAVRTWRDSPDRPWGHLLFDVLGCLPLMTAGYYTAEGLGWPSGVGVGACAVIGLLGVEGARRALRRWIGGGR